MKHTKVFVPMAALAVAFTIMPARAASSDTAFAMRAAEGGMAEVQMAELAKTKATNQAVKDLATKIYNDHSKASDALKPIAMKNNLTWPTALNSKAQAEYNKLQNLSGADFDREYVNFQIKDHKEDISMFQHEVDHGTNADVKSWASENLPTLREHLSMAENAHKQIMNK